MSSWLFVQFSTLQFHDSSVITDQHTALRISLTYPRISGMQGWQSIHRREEALPCDTLMHDLMLPGDLWVMNAHVKWYPLLLPPPQPTFPLVRLMLYAKWPVMCATSCIVWRNTMSVGKRHISAMLQPPRKYTKIARKAVHWKKNSNRYFFF